ncbi:hypothetical protein [Nocardia sp. CC201C]|uniref:hypothetical protein n=1 Tax=Nocardia sp. CC201C TaxID=3044575 RepID=UPI0024A89B51|nr:hypothetical protein [Nocardia sp. CC201C]
MATGVGLRIADDECVAAIVTGDDATLPVHYIVRESRLHMSDDGDAELGGEQPTGHTHSIGGFAAAVGDPAGIPVDDGEAYRAEDLWATAAFCLINLAAEYLEGPAEFYATHPTAWPEENIRAVREALDYLGLKSVVLVSERDLPTPDSDTGKSLAYQAARAALAAVLSTPAGVTPPDPTVTENYSDVTEVLPTIPVPDPPAQAYSVAIPAATTTEPAVEAEAEEPAPEPPTRHRGPLLIAVAAALIGLLLGGLGVAAVLRPDEEKPGPPRGEVRSEPFATAGAVPPEPTPSEELPLPAPPPVVEVPTPTTEPAPPPAPEPPPTTTETPPSSTTTRPSTTTRVPPYIYRPPELPTLQIPPPPIFSDPWSLGEN